MSDDKSEFSESQDSQKDKENEDTGKLKEIVEDLENLPPQLKMVVESSLVRGVSRPYSPITEKIDKEIISKVVDSLEKESEREFEDIKASRWFRLGYLILFVGVFIFITVFLVDKDIEIYREILRILAIFGGGFGAGFGLKTYPDKNK